MLPLTCHDSITYHSSWAIFSQRRYLTHNKTMFFSRILEQKLRKVYSSLTRWNKGHSNLHPYDIRFLHVNWGAGKMIWWQERKMKWWKEIKELWTVSLQMEIEHPRPPTLIGALVHWPQWYPAVKLFICFPIYHNLLMESMGILTNNYYLY